MAFIPNLSGGGAERAVLKLHGSLNPEAIEFCIVAHEKQGSLLSTLDSKTAITYINDGRYSRWQLPKLLISTIWRSRRADVLLGANEGRASFLTLIAGVLLRKPVICWVHNNWTNFSSVVSWKQLVSLKLTSKFSSVLVACSKGVAADLIENFNVPEPKVLTIYHGFHINEIETLALEQIPQDEEFIFRKPVVINVGRLDFQKGQELLIEAHSKIIDKGILHNLILLGQGEREEHLLSIVRKYNVEDSVFFLGFRDNPYCYMKKATVFALSSRFEGFGLVLVEALICQLPIVSTNCKSGPSEILGDGRYGLLVKPESVEEISEGVEKLLLSPELRVQFSSLASSRAEDFQDANKVSEWQNLFRRQVKKQ
ncbi:MAG: glycosyltransferase [Acidiferrobacterales bacterium]|nr:glycosyltransferase [Acidiferrobacterales bacterium]